jgi:hypothetical protein
MWKSNPAHRVVGVDMLVEHEEVDALPPQLLGDLTAVQY